MKLMGLEARFRRYLSERILSVSDYLPAVPKGPLHRLQQLRSHQLSFGDRLHSHKGAPAGSSLALQKIEMIFFYELEDFSIIHGQLRKVIQGNKNATSSLKKIVDREALLDDWSWSDLGQIRSPESPGSSFFGASKKRKLPYGLQSIGISHFRVLPSLAALHFSIPVPHQLASSIEKAANKIWLPEFISDSLRPSRIFNGYRMTLGGAREAIHAEMSKFVDEMKSWISRDLGLIADSFKCRSLLTAYEFDRADKSIPLKKFCSSHHAWLEKFGYGLQITDNYASSHAIVSSPVAESKNECRFEVLFYELDPADQLIEFQLLETVKVVSLQAAALAQGLHYRAKFERARILALKYLKRSRRKLDRSAGVAAAIGLATQAAKRMDTEIANASNWSFDILGASFPLKRTHFGVSVSYIEDMKASIEYSLKQIANSSEIIAPAIQNQMSADTIAVMYRLQNRAFFLTIISSIVAAIGLLSVWDKVVQLTLSLKTAFLDKFPILVELSSRLFQ